MLCSTVTGGTGKQGGAVVDAVLALGLGTVVVPTRDSASAKAEALKARGVEVVAADFNKPETLGPAFTGADAAFLVTDHFAGAGCNGDTEFAQGKNLVDACKAAGVKHVIFSTLENTGPIVGDTLPTLDGKRKTPHFDAKDEIDVYAKSVLGDAYTSLLTSLFYDNFVKGGGLAPNPTGDGGYSLFLPTGDSKFAVGSCKDIGKIVAKLFQEGPSKWGGKTVAAVGEHLNADEIAAAISKVTGVNVIAIKPPTETYVEALKGFGLPETLARDFAAMFTYYRDYPNFTALRPVGPAKELNPENQTLEEWLVDNKEALGLN